MQEMFRRDDVVKLAEGINRIRLGFVVREIEGSHGDFVDSVLEPLGEIQPVPENRAAEIDAWRCISQTVEMAAANAKFWERIVQLKTPPFRASSRFDRDHAGSESSVFRKKR